jgi:hypothetical protein
MKIFALTVRCAALVLVLQTMGCVENPALLESRTLMAQGALDQSVSRLEQGMRDDPTTRSCGPCTFASAIW